MWNNFARLTFKLKSNPYTFQSDLNLYYQTEASYNRTYTETEKTNVFLGAMSNDTRYTKVILDIRDLLPREIDDNVPPEYRLGHIANIICNHSLVEKGVGLDTFYGEATQPHIKSTEAPWDDTEAAVNHVMVKRRDCKAHMSNAQLANSMVMKLSHATNWQNAQNYPYVHPPSISSC